MAYLRDITQKCSVCDSRATHALLNNRNAQNGVYCRRHGAGALRRLQADENERGRVARDGADQTD